MRWLWSIVVGVVGWLVLVVRVVPSWLRGRAVLPRDEPEPTPDPAPVEQRAEEAVSVATAQAEEDKAPHLVALEEAQATVAEVKTSRSKAKRRELLQRLADKANAE